MVNVTKELTSLILAEPLSTLIVSKEGVVYKSEGLEDAGGYAATAVALQGVIDALFEEKSYNVVSVASDYTSKENMITVTVFTPETNMPQYSVKVDVGIAKEQMVETLLNFKELDNYTFNYGGIIEHSGSIAQMREAAEQSKVAYKLSKPLIDSIFTLILNGGTVLDSTRVMSEVKKLLNHNKSHGEQKVMLTYVLAAALSEVAVNANLQLEPPKETDGDLTKLFKYLLLNSDVPLGESTAVLNQMVGEDLENLTVWVQVINELTDLCKNVKVVSSNELH